MGTSSVLLPRTVSHSSLSYLSESSFSSASRLSAAQAEVDGIVTHFLDESAKGSLLSSVVSATATSRFAKVGIMALGSQATGLAEKGVHVLAAVGSLGVEGMTFDLTGRTMETPGTNLNPWKWQGERGLKQGFISSWSTLGPLRVAGRAAVGQNIVFQHTLQSTALVAGQNLAHSVVGGPEIEGSLVSQFAKAEFTNWQMSAGMGLFYTMAPNLYAFERGVDLFTQGMGRNGSIPPFANRELTFALEGRPSSGTSFYDLMHGSVWMSSRRKDPVGTVRSESQETELSRFETLVREFRTAAGVAVSEKDAVQRVRAVVDALMTELSPDYREVLKCRLMESTSEGIHTFSARTRIGVTVIPRMEERLMHLIVDEVVGRYRLETRQVFTPDQVPLERLTLKGEKVDERVLRFRSGGINTLADLIAARDKKRKALEELSQKLKDIEDTLAQAGWREPSVSIGLSSVRADREAPLSNALRKKLDRRIETLEIGAFGMRVFEYRSMRFIGELVQLTEEDALRGYMVGKKGVNEVKAALQAEGLTFGMKVNWQPPHLGLGEESSFEIRWPKPQ